MRRLGVSGRSAAGPPPPAARKRGRSWPSQGPLTLAPPATPGRHADTRRVRRVDNDAPPPRLVLFAVRNARPPLQGINGEIGAPRAAAATPRCMSGRTWAPWRRRRDRPCPAPHWAIFLARGRRAPVVGQVARRINTPLRSLVRSCAHNALFVVCFQAPPTRLRPPCGSRDPNECARNSTLSPASSVASGAIFRPSLGPRHARSCAQENEARARRARVARPLEGPRREHAPHCRGG